MNDFKVIYKILKILQESLEYEELDMDRLSAEALGVTETYRKGLFRMLYQDGLIDGVTIKHYINSGSQTILINPYRLCITMKGLEYLRENSMMKKCANLAKGIAEIL